MSDPWTTPEHDQEREDYLMDLAESRHEDREYAAWAEGRAIEDAKMRAALSAERYRRQIREKREAKRHDDR